jgi:hypothetical protein
VMPQCPPATIALLPHHNPETGATETRCTIVKRGLSGAPSGKRSLSLSRRQCVNEGSHNLFR